MILNQREKVVELLHSTETSTDVRQYHLESNHVQFVDGVRAYALKSFTPEHPIMEAMLDLNTRIFRDFAFTPGFSDISVLPWKKCLNTEKGCVRILHIFH